jgi:hypothetical protein
MEYDFIGKFRRKNRCDIYEHKGVNNRFGPDKIDLRDPETAPEEEIFSEKNTEKDI